MYFINEAFNKDILDILDKYKQDYKLTEYEYVNLITMLLTYLIITRLEISIEDINYIINVIIENRNSNLQVNNNSFVYSSTISYACNKFFNKYGITKESYNTVMNNWFNGYYFHAFNGSFIDLFNSDGINLDNKPWDTSDLDNIANIYGKKVFGFTNGTNNCLFLSSSLSVSPYYSLSTPTFFRRFVENEQQFLNCYLNRDYNTSIRAVNNLCNKNNVSNDAVDYTISFFKKYWDIFNRKKYPGLILFKRNNYKEYELPDNNVIDSVINRISCDGSNFKITDSIGRDKIEIFDYESMSVISKNMQKEI